MAATSTSTPLRMNQPSTARPVLEDARAIRNETASFHHRAEQQIESYLANLTPDGRQLPCAGVSWPCCFMTRENRHALWQRKPAIRGGRARYWRRQFILRGTHIFHALDKGAPEAPAPEGVISQAAPAPELPVEPVARCGFVFGY